VPSIERCPECKTPWFEVCREDGIREWRCSSCGFAAIDGPSAELRNRTYHATTVQLFMEGNQVGAMIGPDLVQGMGGFGSSVPEALRDSAAQLETNGVWIKVDGAM
jgi:Zn ribbon nucleic-acid-binding protein